MGASILDRIFNPKFGAFITFIFAFGFSATVADNSGVYVFLSVLNIPLYLYLGKHFFYDHSDMIESVDNAIGGDNTQSIPYTDEESWRSIKGKAYLISCLAFVTCQYKLWMAAVG